MKYSTGWKEKGVSEKKNQRSCCKGQSERERRNKKGEKELAKSQRGKFFLVFFGGRKDSET